MSEPTTNNEPVVTYEKRIPCADDFVFLDDLQRPYRVRKDPEGLWLYYWNEGLKAWVSLRAVDAVEGLKLFLRKSLSKEKMLLYEGGIPFLSYE